MGHLTSQQIIERDSQHEVFPFSLQLASSYGVSVPRHLMQITKGPQNKLTWSQQTHPLLCIILLSFTYDIFPFVLHLYSLL